MNTFEIFKGIFISKCYNIFNFVKTKQCKQTETVQKKAIIFEQSDKVKKFNKIAPLWNLTLLASYIVH